MTSTFTDEYEHIPVLLAEVLQQLSLQPGSIAVDCTLGGAGHASHFAAALSPGGTLIGIDQDDAALQAATIALNLGQYEDTEILLFKGNFGDLDGILRKAEVPYVDAVFMDLGMSSPQIDRAERGFSFKEEGPLDMRMDQNIQKTAADILATYGERELTQVIRTYGEEKWASRIAQFIVAAREREAITTSAQLVEIIKAAIPASARRAGGHPAKKTFQALRIEVNSELEVLEKGLASAIKWLKPGGRIVVLTYHSLEDRIVKRAFSSYESACTCPPDMPVCVCESQATLKTFGKPIVPSELEIQRNPRARSAKLRVAEKL